MPSLGLKTSLAWTALLVIGASCVIEPTGTDAEVIVPRDAASVDTGLADATPGDRPQNDLNSDADTLDSGALDGDSGDRILDATPAPDSGAEDGGIVPPDDASLAPDVVEPVVDAGAKPDGGVDSGMDDAAADASADAGHPMDAGPDAGFLDVSCHECHGDETSNAPPRALDGARVTSARGVGAHRSHLKLASGWHRDVLCSDCHLVPERVESANHVDDQRPAELSWSLLANPEGSAAFDGVTCSGVYCHGATLSGGTNTSPVWTAVNGTQAACGTCHAIPPPSPHPSSTYSQCGRCHPVVGLTFTDPAKHINGSVDFTGPECSVCHGSIDSPAPPTDLNGGSETSLRGVGAHATHLSPSTQHKEISCSECHIVPDQLDSAGHVDSALPAEVTFGTLSRADGARPRFDGTRCSNTYCHGSTLTGGSNLQPAWTVVDGTQAACGSCHGLPPRAPHPQNPACEACHAGVAGPNQTILNGALHVDGRFEVERHPFGWGDGEVHGPAANQDLTSCTRCHGTSLEGGSTGVSCESCHPGWRSGCTFCHGGTNDDTGAPPASLNGATARSEPGVGAHAQHVGATAIHADWDCDHCHEKPSSIFSPGHMNGGRGEVGFGDLNSNAAYDPTTGTCSNLYCHGNGTRLGSATWTNTTPMGCGSCHAYTGSPVADFQAMSGAHPFHKHLACSTCHAGVWNRNPTTLQLEWVDQTLHINGEANVRLMFSGYEDTYDGQGCAPPCHSPFPWRP